MYNFTCNLSNFFSIPSLNDRPMAPSVLSWQASTLAARVNFVDTSLAALYLNSYRKRSK